MGGCTLYSVVQVFIIERNFVKTFNDQIMSVDWRVVDTSSLG